MNNNLGLKPFPIVVLILILTVSVAIFWMAYLEIREANSVEGREDWNKDAFHFLVHHSPILDEDFNDEYHDSDVLKDLSPNLPYKGLLKFRINDTPINVGTDRRALFRISGFVKNGENTVTIVGDSLVPTYFKIYLVDKRATDAFSIDESNSLLVTKHVLNPGETREYTFRAKTAYDGLFDDLPQEGDERKRIEKQLKDRIRRIEQALVDSDEKLAAKLLRENGEIFDGLFHEHAAERAKFRLANESKLRDSGKIEIVSGMDLFSYDWGKKAVMVYGEGVFSGIFMNPYPCTWKYRIDNEMQRIPTIRFVRRSGKWIALF